MPKKTFLQLDPEKRNRFLAVAMKEFSTKDFSKASISAIVDELGIAKGSVYQYFKDKKDLYLHLLALAQQVKLSYVHQAMADGYSDFWDLFEKMFASGIRFDLEHPRESGLLLLSSQEKQVPELAKQALAQKKQAWEMMQGLLLQELEAGRLRTDLSVPFLAWQVIAVSVGIAEYLTLNYGVDYLENAKNNKPAYALSEAEIMETVRGMIAVLKKGISA